MTTSTQIFFGPNATKKFTTKKMTHPQKKNVGPPPQNQKCWTAKFFFIDATIHIGREIECLPYARFFLNIHLPQPKYFNTLIIGKLIFFVIFRFMEGGGS